MDDSLLFRTMVTDLDSKIFNVSYLVLGNDIPNRKNVLGRNIMVVGGKG